jgi:hypothetical protein
MSLSSYVRAGPSSTTGHRAWGGPGRAGIAESHEADVVGSVLPTIPNGIRRP